MLIVFIVCAVAEDSHNGFEDLDTIRDNERELRLRLAEVRQLLREAGRDPKLRDLSKLQELTDEERRVKAELDAVLQERYRIRLERRGATLEPTKTTRGTYAARNPEMEREERNAAQVERARQAILLRWGVAVILVGLVAIAYIANMWIFRRFTHKKDEDIHAGDRKYA
jgi:hypothetical protein